jgi:2-keto-4-pentenoate hydratase/2-oxohepta-3-ene-1,7-dioic acid hydratase in catechol pathway
MRLATYARDGEPRPAAVRTSASGALELVDLRDADATLPATVQDILAGGAATLARADAAARSTEASRGARPLGSPVGGITLLAPILTPQKILCVGLNYADHAAETGATVGDEPVIFNKLPTCLRGPEAPIELPPESSEVDYEAELVIVIGKTARRVSRDAARSHVAGYCCGHDVSARDWQKNKPGKQWLLGKTFDSFAPLGPWIVTADEVPNPENLKIQMRLNGETMQNSSTKQLIFGVNYLVSYLSHVCTLLPGDLIYTGTPPGVGVARTPPVFLNPGNICEVEVEGLGVLRNPVIAGAP